ncbi:MAG: cysteine desulfurase-like protein [Desulfobacterales bacterium]|nr:cysteine desulfurase-like protein [Desulfobacterales bacterium]MDX2513167.1 cysteine desulfurase-like protein [Desulfobacterales bacterium]
MKFDVGYIRKQFPALNRKINGYPAAYLDGPGGTQVPQRVIDKVVEYLVQHNANAHGAFATSIESDAILFNARKTFADFFACSWEEVSFCQNSTTASFMLSQALSRELLPGDEIIITDMDHEANRGPWQVLEEKGFKLSSVAMDIKNCVIDMADYQAKLTGKTKVVAINYASNAVGTISDVKTMIQMAHDVGALTIVDAVHYALHGAIDVQDIDTDFLYCSAYKFFGPHVGILFAKKSKMHSLQTLKVNAQENVPPYKFETGTLNLEGIAGAAEAVEFIADIGEQYLDDLSEALTGLEGRRKRIVAGMLSIEKYEQPLCDHFKNALKQLPEVTVYTPPDDSPKTSTISFIVENVSPLNVAKKLAQKGVFVWDGDFYAAQPVRSLGLAESGGLIRVGLTPYNTREEIDRALEIISVL